MKDLYAFTQNHNDRPGYVNISLNGSDKLTMTVRADGSDGTSPEASSLDIPITEAPVIIQGLVPQVEVSNKHFRFGHLPESLQRVSAPFGTMAAYFERTLPEGPQKDLMMTKLLEAKDCAVRAALD